MQRTIGWMILVLGMALTAGSARAQIAYEFANSAGVPQSSFLINGIGGTVQIQVYLHETTSGAPELNSLGGLGTSAVRLTYNSPSGIAAVQGIPDVVGAIPPWSFSTTNGSGDFSSSAVLNVASFSGVLPDSNGRILLGTFTFHGVSAGTVNLTAVDPNPGTNTDTTHFSGGIGIDSIISGGTATLVVSPVPEPVLSTVAASAALALAGLYRRIKRRPTPTRLSM